MQQMWVWSLGQKNPLEKEIATHSSILAWEIPWTEEPGGHSLRGRKSWTRLHTHTYLCDAARVTEKLVSYLKVKVVLRFSPHHNLSEVSLFHKNQGPVLLYLQQRNAISNWPGHPQASFYVIMCTHPFFLLLFTYHHLKLAMYWIVQIFSSTRARICLYLQGVSSYLAHRRCSMKFCWMNKWLCLTASTW